MQVQQTKLQGKIEKNKLRTEEIEQHFTTKIDQTEAYMTQTLVDMKRIFDEISRDN